MKFHPPYLISCLTAVVLACGCKSKQEEPAQAQTPPPNAPAAAYPQSAPQDHEAAATNGPPQLATGAETSGGIQTTYSGLQYEVLRPGTGRRPTRYNHVKVNYRGYFPDGRTFDSNNGIVLGLDRVIAGWQEGIPLMKEGAKYRFTIPSHLAYGQMGQPPSIPPNQILMFDIDLLEVKY